MRWVALFIVLLASSSASANYLRPDNSISVALLAQPQTLDLKQVLRPAFLRGGFAISNGITSFTATATYFMAASGCNDANAGTSAGSPWCTPNHAVNAGDVIIAAAGTYNGDFSTWGAVSNAPSATGGINGSGGVYAAILLCGGADLNSCIVDCSTAACNAGHTGSGGRNASSAAMNINASNWSVQGWTIKGNGSSHRGIQIDACLTTTTIIHHVSSINNVISNAGTGFNTDDCGYNQNVPGNGVDYLSGIGLAVQNAAQDPICVAAIDAVGMANFDTNAGTHAFLHGNFSYNNRVSCNSDGESIMFDTLDAHGFQGLAVASHNMVWLAERFGIQVFNQKKNTGFAQTIKVYNNTGYSNCAGQNSGNTSQCGDLNIATVSPFGTTINASLTIQNNIFQSAFATGGGGTGEPVYALALGGVWNALTIGGSGLQNFFKAVATTCTGTCDSGSSPFNAVETDGSSLGTNTYSSPSFTNTTDLISNQSGVPNGTGFENVAQLMGYNAFTATLSVPSVISDLTPTAGGTAGDGYQKPSTACAANADWPAQLGPITYLHWTGAGIQRKLGLVPNVPCNL